jgi:hypothetical protein
MNQANFLRDPKRPTDFVRTDSVLGVHTTTQTNLLDAAFDVWEIEPHFHSAEVRAFGANGSGNPRAEKTRRTNVAGEEFHPSLNDPTPRTCKTSHRIAERSFKTYVRSVYPATPLLELNFVYLTATR